MPFTDLSPSPSATLPRGLRWSAWLLLAVLCACNRGAPPERPVPPGRPEPHATSTDAAALMKVVVPEWSKDATVVIEVPGDGQDEPTAHVAVEKMQVVPLAEDRVVLLLSGRPSDENGNDRSSHSAPGHLGGYWFTRKEGRWFMTAEQPSIAWTGVSGEVGTIKPVSLGGGKVAIAVESGSCWQGYCANWLSLYELQADRASVLLDSERLHSDCESAHASCAGLLQLPPGDKVAVNADDYPVSSGCFNVTGTWRLAARADGPGDLVVHFSGRKTSDQGEAVPAGKGASAESAPDAASAASAATTTEAPSPEAQPPAGPQVLVTVHGVDETMVMRYANGRYTLVQGGNPAPGF
ncbi:hypothetical protein [Eleftheria terrae]|uniref:hypothetical protein n=1 Tax=Eleftheria terrae TaxID=1597781 RepID=UPI00263AF4EB|nr:hypothetical protein [Eleftheria terrae]WKB55408.1 hypothetical protein N7L95_25335 [Eleftheria terrae]